jgi:hypothetical protein
MPLKSRGKIIIYTHIEGKAIPVKVLRVPGV